jgi:ribose transport system permease protein
MNDTGPSALLFLKKFGILLVLLSLILFFALTTQAFFTVTNLFNIARQVSMLGIAAVGMTFVMITGGIDLSVGSLLSIINVIGAFSMVKFGVHPVLAVAICLACACLLGLLNGAIVTDINIPPLIATLGTMTIIRGLSYIITGGLPIYGFPDNFSVIGQGYLWVIPIPVVIMFVIVALGSFILNSTFFGRLFYAIGGNEEATRLSGANIRGLKYLVYALSGFTAGIAGVILLSRVNSGQPIAGSGFELDVVTAVVLGGVSISGGEGSLSGAFTGVLIMGVLSNGLIIMNVGEYYQLVIKGTVLLCAVGFDRMQRNADRPGAKLSPKNAQKAV